MTYEEKMIRDVKLWLATQPGPFVGRTEAEALSKARKAFDKFQDGLSPFELAIRLADALHPHGDGFEIGAPLL